jgi:hypothetical protein
MGSGRPGHAVKPTGVGRAERGHGKPQRVLAWSIGFKWIQRVTCAVLSPLHCSTHDRIEELVDLTGSTTASMLLGREHATLLAATTPRIAIHLAPAVTAGHRARAARHSCRPSLLGENFVWKCAKCWITPRSKMPLPRQRRRYVQRTRRALNQHLNSIGSPPGARAVATTLALSIVCTSVALLVDFRLVHTLGRLGG